MRNCHIHFDRLTLDLDVETFTSLTDLLGQDTMGNLLDNSKVVLAVSRFTRYEFHNFDIILDELGVKMLADILFKGECTVCENDSTCPCFAACKQCWYDYILSHAHDLTTE